MAGPKIPQQAIAVRMVDRVGVDGNAFRFDAKKVPEIAVQTVQAVGSLAAANLAPDIYASYIGSYVTVVDDLGRNVSSVLVVDAKVTGSSVCQVSSPAGVAALVSGIWILKPTTAV